MTHPQPTKHEQPGVDDDTQPGESFVWNVPNALSVVRVVGSVAMLGVAVASFPLAFVALYLVLGFTDLIDGPLARWLNQESKSGAKLDSLADVMLSASLLFGVCWLKGDIVIEHWPWMLAAVASYAAVVVFSLWKFGKFPALHTRSAKINHFMVAIAGVCLLMDLSAIPLMVVCITTLLTNLESLAIIGTLKQWRTDVNSVFDLWRQGAGLSSARKVRP